MANQYQLLVYEGYLGKDPEMRYTPNGTAVTNFNLDNSNNTVYLRIDKITSFYPTTQVTYCRSNRDETIEIEPEDYPVQIEAECGWNRHYYWSKLSMEEFKQLFDIISIVTTEANYRDRLDLMEIGDE